MPKIIAIINQKGGVGKTTTVINLAAGLSLLGKKTLIIDLDPQGNSTSGLGLDKNEIQLSTYDLLIGSHQLSSIIKKIDLEDNRSIHISPSTEQLSGADIELYDEDRREFRLKDQLNNEEINNFDYILIDCPPSLSLLSINALSASDSLLVPIQCEFFAMEGLAQLNKTINLVKERINHNLGIFLVIQVLVIMNTIVITILRE